MASVICGDAAIELAKLKESLDWDRVVIVTDPPFNIGYHYNSYKDNLPEDEYYEKMAKIFSLAPSVVIHYAESLYKLAIKMNESPERVVSWVYNSNTPRQHRDIAFFSVRPDFRKMSQPYKNPNDKRIAKRIAEGKTAKLYDWWNINQVKNVSKKDINHPAVMPLEVMKNIIGILPDDSIIIDPFAGSGTTALACVELGREFVVIEQDPQYVRIIMDRLNPIGNES